ncbi:MAG TPA: isochorismatase family cysteine hydrolase [Verrucomicrobiae bacterium]|nr:isochorismatase family cysteine hydrolase [Verrucomicrobiae bacterium]
MNGDEMLAPKHPSGINQAIVDKVFARRGRLHAFPNLNSKKTALVVIDLDTGTVARVNDEIRKFIPIVNSVATALRKRGGTLAWVTTPIRKANDNFRAVYGQQLSEMYEGEGVPEGKATVLWHELNSQPQDVYAIKAGASAFFPGKGNLHEQLQRRGINTVLIVGAVTNVCCEASARDAAELEYKVTMISDALWGHGNGLHEATLATFFRNYGDVRPASEVLELIG